MPTDLAAECTRAAANCRRAAELRAQAHEQHIYAKELQARAQEAHDIAEPLLAAHRATASQTAPPLATIPPDQHGAMLEALRAIVTILHQFDIADQVALTRALVARTLVVAGHHAEASPPRMTLSA